MIARCGEVNVHHWAHEHLSKCDGTKEETAWHKAWKEKFPEDYREKVFSQFGQKRIADIQYGNQVLEFESRRIELVELRSRNNFWIALGFKPLWVFQCLESRADRLERTRSLNIYWFKNGFKRLIGFRTPFVIDFNGETFEVRDYWYLDDNGRIYLRGSIVEITSNVGF